MHEYANRTVRNRVRVPNGSEFSGRFTSSLKVVLPEHELRNHLAVQLGGVAEACLPYGRPDVLTATTVFEVEPVKAWRHAVRQVHSYAAQTGCVPAVALFGRASPDKVLGLYVKLRDSAPPIEFWCWDGCWVKVTSRKACRAMPEWPPPGWLCPC